MGLGPIEFGQSQNLSSEFCLASVCLEVADVKSSRHVWPWVFAVKWDAAARIEEGVVVVENEVGSSERGVTAVSEEAYLGPG